MAEFDAKTREIITRLQAIRVKMQREQPFYAVLLMQLKYAVDVTTPTLYTDARRIAFNPFFIAELNETELRFALMHEVMHVALGHCFVEREEYNHLLFNIACDIVVNSNILYSFGMNRDSICIGGEETMHLVPNGDEGYLYDVHEVYAMLVEEGVLEQLESAGSGATVENDGSASSGDDGEDGDDEGDSQSGTAPTTKNSGDNKTKAKGKKSKKNRRMQGEGTQFDDHTFWTREENREEQTKWAQSVVEATEIATRLDEVYTSKFGGDGCGNIPMGAERLLKELLNPQIDWRTMLENFIQEEVNDYTFSPPDKRFSDSPFFLPDFNDMDERVRNVVFLVDTSGSMSDAMIQTAYSEIKGAIDMFGGKLEGYIVAGDTQAYEMVPFGEDTDIAALVPRGGGGTNFEAPIRYVLEEMEEEPPCCMIYITDGFCRFPDEELLGGIPMLWLLTTEVIPPWGKVAYLQIEG